MCVCVWCCVVQRYSVIDEEDMVQATQSDISTLCGQNMLLWMQYLELVTFSKIITHQLAKEHHLQRVLIMTVCYTALLSFTTGITGCAVAPALC